MCCHCPRTGPAGVGVDHPSVHSAEDAPNSHNSCSRVIDNLGHNGQILTRDHTLITWCGVSGDGRILFMKNDLIYKYNWLIWIF